MSTPSLTPFESDLISPYAPKWAQEQALAATKPTDDESGKQPLPKGIETHHDAKILDDIENSLRDMIAAAHSGESQTSDAPAVIEATEEPTLQPEMSEDEPIRLSEVSKAAAEQVAQELQRAKSYAEALRSDDPLREPMFNEQAAPAWLLPRSLEPSPVPEPWPRPRKGRRNRVLSLAMYSGLVATVAAVLATAIVQDIPSSLYQTLRTSFVELSSNASAVYNEGKASSLQTRMEATTKQQNHPAPASVQLAAADPVAMPQHPPATPAEPAAKSAAEPNKTVAPTTWPSPKLEATRTEAAVGQSPSGRSEIVDAKPAAPAPAPTPAKRVLSSEEIAMLRKQGDDFIAVGDFVGARAVLERAADAGDASAALALAATYDPAVLARFKVRGLAPDVVKAGFWYERARTLGSSEAPRRLQTLAAGN